MIAFALAFIRYFMLITDFGFNLSATREISIYRDDIKKVSKIFYSVFIIKALLAIISLLIIVFVVNYFDKFSSDKMVYYLTSLSILGWIMFPQWFFQGIENMKFVTLFNVLSKLFFTISVFIFIKTQDDYLILPLLTSLGLIFSGVFSLIVSLRFFNLKFELPAFSEIKHQFIEGWHVFVSNISINLYTTSNSVLLGFLTNNQVVGYYSAAERIFIAFQQLGMPLFQALFPYFSKLIIDNREKPLAYSIGSLKLLCLLHYLFLYFYQFFLL
ncbi:MAG: oligosaccharide flippase family protein [Ignavibacteriales bacterium]|nr:oligosaccharide flippase family protein [Ignavibacteriales bacterium]